jgi:hypothetical protein
VCYAAHPWSLDCLVLHATSTTAYWILLVVVLVAGIAILLDSARRALRRPHDDVKPKRLRPTIMRDTPKHPPVPPEFP